MGIFPHHIIMRVDDLGCEDHFFSVPLFRPLDWVRILLGTSKGLSMGGFDVAAFRCIFTTSISLFYPLFIAFS